VKQNLPNDLPATPRPAVRDREGTTMLIHEALARSRQQEAIRAAERHALARSVAAGRTWSTLARFATRRAARARAAAGVAPLTSG
jgi:hypothetical protein